MHDAATPPNMAAGQEAQRLRVLARYGILDMVADSLGDDLCRLTAGALGVPYAFAAIVDEGRIWSKASFGLQPFSLTRPQGPCGSWCSERLWLSASDLQGQAILSVLPDLMCIATVPLMSPDGFGLGFVAVGDRVLRGFEPAAFEQLEAAARLMVGQFERRRAARTVAELVQQKTEAEERIDNFSTRDPLTGLLNRGHFIHALEALAEREDVTVPSALAVFSLKAFGSVNAQHGHDIGDQVIAAVGELMEAAAHRGDYVGRLSGAEFAMALNGLALDGAERIAGLLAAEIARLPILVGDVAVPVDVSFGVAMVARDTGVAAAIRAAHLVMQAATGAESRSGIAA